MARLIALVYTWWNHFIRQISPFAHREGHVSRPIVLNGIAHATTHGRKTTLHLTSLHAKAAIIIAALTAIADRIKNLAKVSGKQLSEGIRINRWNSIIEAIFEPFLKAREGPSAAVMG